MNVIKDRFAFKKILDKIKKIICVQQTRKIPKRHKVSMTFFS